MGQWVRTSDVAQWVRTSDVAWWVSTRDVAQWVRTSDMGQWVRTRDLAWWLGTHDLAWWVRAPDMGQWVRTSDVAWWLRTRDLAWWVSTRDVAQWVRTSDMGQWVRTRDLAWWLGTHDLAWWVRAPDMGQWVRTSDVAWWLRTSDMAWWLRTRDLAWWVSTRDVARWVRTSDMGQWVRTSDVARWVKPRLVKPASSIGCSASRPAPATAPGRQRRMAQCRALTHLGDLDGAPGSWFQPVPGLAVVATWGVNHGIKGPSLCLSNQFINIKKQTNRSSGPGCGHLQEADASPPSGSSGSHGRAWQGPGVCGGDCSVGVWKRAGPGTNAPALGGDIGDPAPRVPRLLLCRLQMPPVDQAVPAGAHAEQQLGRPACHELRESRVPGHGNRGHQLRGRACSRDAGTHRVLTSPGPSRGSSHAAQRPEQPHPRARPPPVSPRSTGSERSTVGLGRQHTALSSRQTQPSAHSTGCKANAKHVDVWQCPLGCLSCHR
nr:uncharacterized protein LOC127482743 isoform X1 [Oryctolagus cuniculus]